MRTERLNAAECLRAERLIEIAKRTLTISMFSRVRTLLSLPQWFPFLRVTNFTKLKRLHRAASCAITSCFSSSPIPLLLSEASLPPLRITLSFYERALCPQTPFSLQVWPDLERNQDSSDPPEELLRPLIYGTS